MANEHGGARAGAGRPKGGANRVSKEAVDQARASGKMPLDYLLEIMRDTTADDARRIDCAKAAAPYLHAKLASIEISGDPDKPLHTTTEVRRTIVYPARRDVDS